MADCTHGNMGCDLVRLANVWVDFEDEGILANSKHAVNEF